MKLSTRSHTLSVFMVVGVLLGFSNAFAVTTGKVRCLGFQGYNASNDPDKLLYLAVQAHNPNAPGGSNIQRITRIKGWPSNGQIEDSGPLPQPAYRLYPNKSIEYLIPSFFNYEQTSYAVEITWTNSSDTALPPMIQTWAGLVSIEGGFNFLAAVPVMCQ